MTDRRAFLAICGSSLAGLTGFTMLRSRGIASHGGVVVPLADSAVARSPMDDVERLNLALNLAYLGAQFHARAAVGDGLPAALLGGVGDRGIVRGGRQVAFDDPALDRYAHEIADDKTAHIIALRHQLGTAAAAQPAIDLSLAPSSGFTRAGHAACLGPAEPAFDPFSSDAAFLLGAFVVGNEAAACNRLLLTGLADPAAHAVLASVLADTIYHGGLIRAVVASKAEADPALAQALASLSKAQAAPRADGGYAADLTDAEGNPIPFLRAPAQMVCQAGGFFPAGFNGIGTRQAD